MKTCVCKCVLQVSFEICVWNIIYKYSIYIISHYRWQILFLGNNSDMKPKKWSRTWDLVQTTTLYQSLTYAFHFTYERKQYFLSLMEKSSNLRKLVQLQRNVEQQSWTKYLEKTKEIQQNWTETENFDNYFCAIFDCSYKLFISGRKTGN